MNLLPAPDYPSLKTLLGYLLLAVPTFLFPSFANEIHATPALSHSIHALRSLTDEQIRTQPVVILRGVLTFYDPESGIAYLQDQSGGIELRELPPGAWHSGQSLEVTGYIDAAKAIPGLRVRTFATSFEAPPAALPASVPYPASDLTPGALDGCRVAMEAAVLHLKTTRQPKDRLWLQCEVQTLAGHRTWLIPWSEETPLPQHLLHAKVRAQGICEAIFNNQEQRIGELLFIQSLDNVTILREPSPHPFDRPTRSLAELGRPGLNNPFDRARVEGVVLCQQITDETLIHLRTTSGALQVHAPEGDFQVGEHLAAVGYPFLEGKHISLREASLQALATSTTPLPIKGQVRDLLLAGHDSDLIRITGLVLRNTLSAQSGSIFIASDDQVIEVLLTNAFRPAQRLAMAKSLSPGAELALTGVAELEGKMLTSGTVKFSKMRLTLRTPADITLLRPPPWWTEGKLLSLAAFLAAGLALGAAWVLALRHRVRLQTEVIREKVSRETRWLERSRIARDIHDDVGSSLTQITLLSDLGLRGERDLTRMERQFERISTQAREAVRALDTIVWTINPKNDNLAVTVSYLCQIIQDLTRDAGIRCRFEVPDELEITPLGARLRHNLVLVIKEVVHNIIKHSGAQLVRLRMESLPEALVFEVTDDGCGFDLAQDSSARTGLDSIAQRMREVGGSCEITSHPGQGTSVRCLLPWSAKSLPST